MLVAGRSKAGKNRLLGPGLLIVRTGHQHLQAVAPLIAVAHPGLVAEKAPAGPADFGSSHFDPPPGDDVDYREKGAAAIESEAGSPDDLHPFDEVDVHGKIVADESHW